MEDTKNVAAENVVETETTQADSPQAKEEPTTPKTKEVTQEEALPESDEEQRKAFQEMRLENKQLKEKMAEREKSESAFDAFKPKPQVGTFTSEQFTDPITGEFDVDAYTRAQQANNSAVVAQQVQETIAQERDESNARSKHPEAFSDPEVEQEVADKWFAAKMRGEDVTVTQVAAKVAKRFKKAVTKAEKEGAEKALNEVAPKEQAALSASGQNSSNARRQASALDDAQQMESIRHGSDDSLADAMSKIPWANK